MMTAFRAGADDLDDCPTEVKRDNYMVIKFRRVLICFFEVLVLLTMLAVAEARTVGDAATVAERRSFQLRLVGTAVADDPEVSLAVIESGIDGQQRSYHEGEPADGILIKEILRNRVIVETEHGEEFISLSRPLPTEAERQGTSQSPLPVSFGPRPQESLRKQTLYLDGKSITAELANFEDMIREIDVDTVSIYGQPAGVKIYPIAQDSIFSEIGLKNGDVIKEVNGIEITRPEQVIAVFHQLKAGENVDLKVKGRRTRQIHLIIE